MAQMYHFHPLLLTMILFHAGGKDDPLDWDTK